MSLVETQTLITRQAEPLNAETPLEALADVPLATPLFYVRCNFGIPEIDAARWRLRVHGRGARTARFLIR